MASGPRHPISTAAKSQNVTDDYTWTGGVLEYSVAIRIA